MDNMRIFHAFEHTPKEAKKQITGGRLNGMTDVNPMFRIKMLTDRFGPCGIGWYTEITRQETVAGAKGELMCFIDLNLYYRENGEGEWSKPVFGTGGNALISIERSGPYANDEGWKMAYTDALSIACKNLGMCADVYFEKGYGKYTSPMQPNSGGSTQNGAQRNSAQPAQGHGAGARQNSGKPVQGQAQGTDQSNAAQRDKPGPVMATVQQIEFIRNFASDSLYQNAMESFGAELERMTYNQGQKMVARINEENRKNEDV